MSKANPKCMDCGKPYKDFPLDTVLPNDQWRAINPQIGGLLCANCIVARGAKLPHVIVANLSFDIATPPFSPCNCPNRYSIEPHGNGYALYLGRCGHRHGYTLANLSELSDEPRLNGMLRQLNASA